MLNKEKGITLIALVVTIIILLILAGVTLSLALNQEGLFNRARNAGEQYEAAQKNETDIMNYFTNMAENIMATYDN